MRSILDLRTNKVLRICGSSVGAMRTFAMLQIERDKLRKVMAESGIVHKSYRRLAICELTTTRHIGDTVSASEFTIIHAEKEIA